MKLLQKSIILLGLFASINSAQAMANEDPETLLEGSEVPTFKELTAKALRKKLEDNLRKEDFEAVMNDLDNLPMDLWSLVIKGPIDKWSEATLLHIAAEIAPIDIINRFIELGAEVDAQNFVGVTPLMMAAGKDRIDVIDALIDKGADVNAQFNARDQIAGTILHLLAERDQAKTIKALIKRGADKDARTPKVETSNYYRETPLHIAAKYGNNDAIKALLDEGAEINAKNNYDQTPLKYAKRYSKVIHLHRPESKHTEAIDTLIARGATE